MGTECTFWRFLALAVITVRRFEILELVPSQT